MQLFKKLYCRTYQGVLRAALPVLPYRKPVQLKKVEDIADVLKEKNKDKVLLVTDSGIRGFGLTSNLENHLKENGILCVVYDKTVANPTDLNVEEAVTLYHENDCQAIIGFGGGSSMDCAKAAGARIASPKKPLSKMEGILKVHRKLPLLFAVPTTSGTGSEVTLASVITDHETHHKYAITDFNLIPNYAALDPEITRSLPPFLTACTGMDALTHAVEAYIGRSTTKETRHDATEAVKLIVANLREAFDNGNDMTARKNLSVAAYLAGNAFSKSYVGYVHAVAHSLSGKYNVPHGYANAVILPYVLELYGPCIHKKLAELAIAAGIAKEGDHPARAAVAFIRMIREFNRYFNIPTCISELQEEDIDALAVTADREANPLYPVPRLMDAAELKGIYEMIKEENYDFAGNRNTGRKTKTILPKRENLGSAVPC